jgi:hypothetical protein
LTQPPGSGGDHPLIGHLASAIVVEAVATAVIALLLLIWRRAAARLALRDPRLALLPVALAIAGWVAGAALTILAASSHAAHWWVLSLLFMIPTLLLAYLIVSLLRGVWGSGIHGGDIAVRRGINYARALSLVRNDMSFLGTSAAKLTGQENFEEAVARCRPDRPIRFLLMKPDDANLRNAAQRSGRDRDEYRRIAIGSLRALRGLREDRGIGNLEVRFYDTATYEPIFRLMFIDESFCLASFNVYGRGDGSELPQLHVVKAADAARSFYSAFDRYFNNLWTPSVIWDFDQYL